MCNPISCVLTKEAVYFGNTDSHERIIEQHGLHEGMPTAPNFVRVEVAPPEDDTTVPVEQWVYRLDQDILPVWYDEQDCMTRARAAVVRSGVGVAWAAYEAIEQPAWAAYEAIKQPAWAAYKAIKQPAWAAYEAIKQPAWAAYKAIKQPAWAAYEAIEQPALAAYEAIKQPAWAAYEAIRQPALAAYEAIRQPAWAAYEAKRREIARQKW